MFEAQVAIWRNRKITCTESLKTYEHVAEANLAFLSLSLAALRFISFPLPQVQCVRQTAILHRLPNRHGCGCGRIFPALTQTFPQGVQKCQK